ncbi:hypothetical protein E4T52_11669 [Aureobasidium sp. EXF-3400]|nr:hypothetical protein E4T51_01050 [Aureobasidium sp. EXF-12344]KAI4773364.1 hypothetical protein E4T52_11669 [Aureobasidium sp. EXF-3400]
MASLIDWNSYPSDGVPGKFSGTPSTRLGVYTAELVKCVNKDPAILSSFGPAGVDFTSLPTNYVLETRPRATDTGKGSDDYVHGHPKHNFRSAKTFAVHVVALLQNTVQSCRCASCRPDLKPKKSKAESSTSQTTVPSNPNAGSSSPIMDVDYPEPAVSSGADQDGTDQDGTPNVFDRLMHQAKQGQPMSKEITEPNSMHWLLEREVANLPTYLKSMKISKRYHPRLGEIVLIARNVKDKQNVRDKQNVKDKQSIRFDDQSGIYKIHDTRLGWVGLPMWEAAVVTQMDKEAVTAGLLDQNSGNEGADINGFRVEPVSEAGNPNKAWSTRYERVNMFNIRPFSLWQELTNGADVDDPHEFHPTIRNALTAMSSLSVVDRFHFCSSGHEARIYCNGFFLGAEFITSGDVVRFTSPIHIHSFGKDVILVKHIYMSINLNRDPSPGSVHVEGVAYTTDPEHASGQFQRPVPAESLPDTMRDYGLWYKMSEGNASITVPYTKLLTRLVEGVYMKVIVGEHTLTKVTHGGGARHLGLIEHIVDITYGIQGVRDAREYSRKHDPRIKRNEGQAWYIGEDRVDQLDLHQLNDQDVGDRARFGFESNPTPLQASQLKAMFRARAARQKGPKVGGNTHSALPRSVDFATQEELDKMQHGIDVVEQGLDKFSNLRAMAMFENQFTKRVTDADWDKFID